MPVAAVPKYLGSNFHRASPGMRFGIYLPIWTDRADQEREVQDRAGKRSPEAREVADLLKHRGMDVAIAELRNREWNRLPGLWEKNDSAAREAWNKVKAINKNDKDCMAALLCRQRAAFGARGGAGLVVKAKAIAPFTTGLGNEHPLENGFAFLNPYGLPYLPGSGVKGVLRQAAWELASGMWEQTHGWNTARGYRLMRDGEPVLDEDKQPVLLSMLDVLFGRETPEGESDHVRGALSFWDVLPRIAGDTLMVDIMTPHQKHYYQDGRTPHDSGQPTPISFLTVPPGSVFVFHVVCDLAHLQRVSEHRTGGAPDLLAGGATHWKALLEAAFQHAFDWLGFGAKGAVGYGRMERLPKKAADAGASAGTVAAAPSDFETRIAQVRALPRGGRAAGQIGPLVDWCLGLADPERQRQAAREIVACMSANWVKERARKDERWRAIRDLARAPENDRS